MVSPLIASRGRATETEDRLPGQPAILIVEDDVEISALMARYLESNQFSVRVARDGAEMRRLLAATTADLIVLDLNLPDEDGLDLCLALRASGAPPIIMVTAKGEDVDRIIGLEMGADDYLPKPFNPRELLARIKAVLRRSSVRSAEHDGITFAGWTLVKSLRQLTDPRGVRVMVTSAEFDLLTVLSDHPGRVLSRERLLEMTQGARSGSQERSIDILVSRLRLKIESDPREPTLIQTVRSLGYLFAAEVRQR